MMVSFFSLFFNKVIERLQVRLMFVMDNKHAPSQISLSKSFAKLVLVRWKSG